MIRYAGIYAKGMQEPVLIELRLLGYTVEEHYLDHRVIVFKSQSLEKEVEVYPLCLLFYFQLIGSYGIKGKHIDPIIEFLL